MTTEEQITPAADAKPQVTQRAQAIWGSGVDFLINALLHDVLTLNPMRPDQGLDFIGSLFAHTANELRSRAQQLRDQPAPPMAPAEGS